MFCFTGTGNSLYVAKCLETEPINNDKRINKYHYFEEIDLEQADYAVMMDSLEYMEDDAAYIKKMCGKIKKGGFFSSRFRHSHFFFTYILTLRQK